MTVITNGEGLQTLQTPPSDNAKSSASTIRSMSALVTHMGGFILITLENGPSTETSTPFPERQASTRYASVTQRMCHSKANPADLTITDLEAKRWRAGACAPWVCGAMAEHSCEKRTSHVGHDIRRGVWIRLAGLTIKYKLHAEHKALTTHVAYHFVPCLDVNQIA